MSADAVINRIRPKTAKIPGATLFLQAVQDIRVGGRGSNSQYQYTLRADNLQDLNTWSDALLRKLRSVPEIRDANTDQQNRGLELTLDDRPRYRVPARDQPASDRPGSLRCVRAAAGLDDLHGAEPVSRGDGSSSRKYQDDPANLARCLRSIHQRRTGPAQRFCARTSATTRRCRSITRASFRP